MKKVKVNKLHILLATSIVFFVASIAYPTVAWFTKGNRTAHVGQIEINIPPLIYIRDDGLEEMTSFNLDGLQINTKYDFVFCVAPSKKDTVKSFSLGVFYTENIGMIINVYPVNSISTTKPAGSSEERTVKYTNKTSYTAGPSGEAVYYFGYDTTDASWQTPTVGYGKDFSEDPTTEEGNLNRGIRKLYQNLVFEKNSKNWKQYTSIEDEIQDKGHYVFFIMEITWDDSITVNTDKEVDIVYLSTKGTGSTDSSGS